MIEAAPPSTLQPTSRQPLFTSHFSLFIFALLVATILISLAASVKFNVMGFDLAFYQQAVWNTLQGRPFAVSATEFSGSLLGTDLIISPIILTLPFYALFPSPITLLVLQAVVTCLGAFVLYLIARRALGDWWGVAVAILYLLYPPVQNAAMTESAFRPFAATGLLLCIYLYETERWRWFWLAAITTLLVRSELGLVLAAYGLYTLLEREPLRMGRVNIMDSAGSNQLSFLPVTRWRQSLGLIVMGLAWFLLAGLVIVPAFAGGRLAVAEDAYGGLGSSLGAVAGSLLTNPLSLFANHSIGEVAEYLFRLLLPLAFLPLLRPLRLLPALPSLLLNILSRRGIQLRAWGGYYQVFIAVFFTYAAIGALADLRSGRGWWGKIAAKYRQQVASGMLAIAYIIVLGLNIGIGPVAQESEVLANLRSYGKPAKWQAAAPLIAQIPADASLSVGNALAPHLPPRQKLWLAQSDPHYTLDPLAEADYLLVDTSYSEPKQKQVVEQARADKNWQQVEMSSGYALFKRVGR